MHRAEFLSCILHLGSCTWFPEAPPVEIPDDLAVPQGHLALQALCALKPAAKAVDEAEVALSHTQDRNIRCCTGGEMT